MHWRLPSIVSSARISYATLTDAFQESSQGQAVFTEEEPEVIDQILVFLYTGGVYDDLAVISDETATTKPDDESTIDVRSLRTPIDTTGAVWRPEHPQPHVTLLEAASKAMVTKVLTTGILVYATATMMDLSDLHDLAVQRFLEKEQYLIKSDLPAVLEALFKHTSPDDSLRMKIIGRCIENHSVLKDYSKAVEVLHEHEFSAGMGFGILQSWE